MLFKETVDARTHARTDGRRTTDIEGSQKLTEHFVLRWAKNPNADCPIYYPQIYECDTLLINCRQLIKYSGT